jgi:hypothetical protein
MGTLPAELMIEKSANQTGGKLDEFLHRAVRDLVVPKKLSSLSG